MNRGNRICLDSKGFSLVELIIVIAVMVILAGALAPALIKYIEKSRKSKDIQNATTLESTLVCAFSDGTIKIPEGERTVGYGA